MKTRATLYALCAILALSLFLTARLPYYGKGLVWDFGGIDLAYTPMIFLCRPYSMIFPAFEADC